MNMQKLRVALVQPALPHYRLPLFRELADRSQIDLRVFYGQEPNLPNVEPRGFRATFAPQQPLLARSAYWHGAQLAAAVKSQADVWITGSNPRYLSMLPGVMTARANGLGVVLWGHGYSKSGSAARNLLLEQALRSAHANLFYDETTAARFAERGMAPERIFVARNAIEQAGLQAARRHLLEQPDELRAFRQAAGVNPDKLLLFVSRLTPRRRFDVLLQAIAQLSDPEIQLVQIGGGPYVAEMQRLAQNLGVEHQVRWLGAKYEASELAPWFMSARAMCFPSAIGLSIYTSFAFGVPVIVGDDRERHNPEIDAFAHGQNGLAFKHDDPQALASLLRGYLIDREREQALSEGALATAERYSIATAVDGFIGAIEYAAEKAKRS